jgi:hypothetical protein
VASGSPWLHRLVCDLQRRRGPLVLGPRNHSSYSVARQGAQRGRRYPEMLFPDFH